MFVKQLVEVDLTHSKQPCTSTFLKDDGHSAAWYAFWDKKCPVCKQEAVIKMEEQDVEVVKYKFVRQKSAIDRALS